MVPPTFRVGLSPLCKFPPDTKICPKNTLGFYIFTIIKLTIKINHHIRTGVHNCFCLGLMSLFTSSLVMVRNQFFAVVGLWPSFSCWLLARGYSQHLETTKYLAMWCSPWENPRMEVFYSQARWSTSNFLFSKQVEKTYQLL